jgi:hypothetical protein
MSSAVLAVKKKKNITINVLCSYIISNLIQAGGVDAFWTPGGD